MKPFALVPLVGLLGCELEGPAGEHAVARDLVAIYGCAACHRIPDVPGADALTGPPLTDMARQVYVAGVVPNTPEALAAFIVDPQAIDPRSAMPDLGVSPDEALTIAEFLYAVGGGGS